MKQPALATRSAWRVRAYVVLGIALGTTYAALDFLLGHAVSGPLLPLARFSHHVIDRVVPIVAGALAGIAVHYVQVRSALARAEAQRAEELEQRLQRIERDQAVWVVAAATLHEVKNPLHALGLLIDELAALPPNSTATRDTLMGKARGQIERANTSLASLRALARSARPDCRVVQVGELATAVAREMSAIAERDGLHIRIHASPVLAKSDPSFVRIILENLIANGLDALRQRGGEGEIDIEVTTVGRNAIVRVRDDGPGLDRRETELFEPLATSKADGLGLGLSIARALARTMHGDLAWVPDPGWATAFELRLPGAA